MTDEQKVVELTDTLNVTSVLMLDDDGRGICEVRLPDEYHVDINVKVRYLDDGDGKYHFVSRTVTCKGQQIYTNFCMNYGEIPKVTTDPEHNFREICSTLERPMFTHNVFSQILAQHVLGRRWDESSYEMYSKIINEIREKTNDEERVPDWSI